MTRSSFINMEECVAVKLGYTVVTSYLPEVSVSCTIH